jgi:hypothetical protein
VQQRQPRLGGRERAEIGRNPLRIGRPAPRDADISSGRHDLVAGGIKPRQTGRTDQAVSADEHAHGVLRRKLRGPARRALRFAA